MTKSEAGDLFGTEFSLRPKLFPGRRLDEYLGQPSEPDIDRTCLRNMVNLAQIAFALRPGESGTPIAAIVGKMGITE